MIITNVFFKGEKKCKTKQGNGKRECNRNLLVSLLWLIGLVFQMERGDGMKTKNTACRERERTSPAVILCLFIFIRFSSLHSSSSFLSLLASTFTVREAVLDIAFVFFSFSTVELLKKTKRRLICSHGRALTWDLPGRSSKKKKKNEKANDLVCVGWICVAQRRPHDLKRGA